MTEPCSPTKPAAPFSPESWYRKAYEELSCLRVLVGVELDKEGLQDAVGIVRRIL